MKDILEKLGVSENEFQNQLNQTVRVLNGEIPDELFCSLTGQIFHEPVKLPSGQTVERTFIEEWVKKHKTNPFNRDSLEISDLKPDFEKSKEVENELKAHENSQFIESIKAKIYTPDDLLHMGSGLTNDSFVPDALDDVNLITDNDTRSIIVSMSQPQRRNRGNGSRNHHAFQHTQRNGWNEDMARVCQELELYGLTRALISRLESINNFHYSSHGEALIYLITGELPLDRDLPSLEENLRLTAEMAIEEINRLHPLAYSTLIDLYSYGLRGDHLRSIEIPDGRLFSSGHHFLLTYLIKEQRISPLEAVQQVNGLSSDDALNAWREATSSLPSNNSYN